MSLLGNFQREFIARPDEFKDRIVFKWPDENIRRQTRLTVEADEQAVFFRSGQVVGMLGPGVSVLDSSEIPFLGNVVDQLTGGNFFKTELYFVSVREFPNLPFGGAVDNVLDPQTQLGVGLRAFGDYSLRVTDPSALVTKLVGTQDLGQNDEVTDWTRDQLMKAFRTVLVGDIMANSWPILGLAAHTPQIEQETLVAAQQSVAGYGLEVARLGNFTVTIKPEDEENLKRYLAQVQYSKLAGGFQQAAAAEALEGIGEGAAKGGEAANVAALGVGLAASKLISDPQGGQAAPGQAPEAVPVAARFCSSCGAQTTPGAKFCANCGAALQQPAG
ncbi:MAG TPA: SPFH domain-containing protein [Candidatus Dormibacteraeota bacterium]